MSLVQSSRNGETTPNAVKYIDLSFIANTLGAGVPILDQEWNLKDWIQSENLAAINRTQVPSGWLTKIQLSNAMNMEGALKLSSVYSNHMFLVGENEVMVNGYKVNLARTKDGTDNKIELNAPPVTGTRLDLVFLEVWFKEITEPLTASTVDRRAAGLLDDGSYPIKGNVDYFGTGLRTDGVGFDAIDPAVGLETNRRIQVQHRIRVVDNVDYNNHPEGVSDSGVVKAWPAHKRDTGDTILESTLTFTKSGTDEGVYIAGAGDSASKAALGSLDGYMYAIPICLVHRRNSTVYNQVSNTNGVDLAIGGGDSPRPDGLYNDQIDIRDILDLRHQVSFNSFNFDEILTNNLSLLLRGDLNTNYVSGDGVGVATNVRGTTIMYCEQFGGNDVNNVNNRNLGNNINILDSDPNGQRRNWNDAVNSETCHAKITQTSTTLPVNVSYGVRRTIGSGNWVQSDTIKISTPVWALIDVGEIYIYDEQGNEITSDFSMVVTDNSAVDCMVTPAVPTWSGESSLHIVYTTSYPVGGGMLHAPKKMLKVEDQTLALWGGDADLGKRNAYSIIGGGDFNLNWDSASQFGYQYSEEIISVAVNQIEIVLPAGYNAVGIGGINNLTTSLRLEGSIMDWSQAGQTITITFSSGIAIGNNVEVSVYLDRFFIRLQEETKAILGTYETKEVIVTVDGSGDGDLYFEYNEIGLFKAAMYSGVNNLRDASNNTVTGNILVSPHKVTISGCSAVTQPIKVAITFGKTLVGSEHLRLWYEYNPYMGNGTVKNDFIIKASEIGLLTGGTGTLGGYDVIGVPPITQLPLGANAHDYNFAGEEIIDKLTSVRNIEILGAYRLIDNKQQVYDQSLFEVEEGVVSRGHKMISKNFNTLIGVTGIAPIANSIITYGGAFVQDGKMLQLYVSTVNNSMTYVPGAVVVDPSSENSSIDSFHLFGRPLIK